MALKSGEIRMYSSKNLIDKLETGEICNGLIIGVFGKQDSSLIINFKSGALVFKHLNKEAKLSQNALRPGPPPE